MPLLDHAHARDLLGPSISQVPLAHNFRGALVNRSGMTTQVVARNVTSRVTFDTEVYDVGEWFSNANSTLQRRLTVPDGVSLIRFAYCLNFSPGGFFVPGDDVLLEVQKNDVSLFGYARSGYAPQNDFNVVPARTQPIPCVPGDYFSVGIQPLTSNFSVNVNVNASTRSMFAIEAVRG